MGGDLPRALAAYNAGLAGSAGGPAAWPAETRAYVAAVLRGAGAAGSVPVVGGALAGGARSWMRPWTAGELRPRLVG